MYMTEVKDDVSTPSLHGNSIPINTLLGMCVLYVIVYVEDV